MVNEAATTRSSSSSYLHDRVTVRSVQVPHRCPDHCQEWCSNWPTQSQAQLFPGCVIRRLSACAHVPHREGSSMSGLPLFNIGSETDEGVPKDKGLAELRIELKAQYAIY